MFTAVTPQCVLPPVSCRGGGFVTQEAGFVECGFVFCVSVPVEWAGLFPWGFQSRVRGPVYRMWQWSVPVFEGWRSGRNT